MVLRMNGGFYPMDCVTLARFYAPEAEGGGGLSSV